MCGVYGETFLSQKMLTNRIIMSLPQQAEKTLRVEKQSKK